MSMFAKVTKAPAVRTDAAKKISLFYAGILAVLVIAQLFTFDEFIQIIPTFNLPVGDGWVAALPAIIVTSELFALPFLLRMSVSVAFRWLSMMLGWVVAGLWTAIALWVVASQQVIESIGFLGGLVALLPGAWVVLFALSLGILAAWSSWGLWPGKRAKK